tara:strand:+ start:110 stop:736 length:627 start_codon:yes stop_codon:yes gene_type:complete
LKSLQEKGEIIVAVEEIDTRKEMVAAMTDVEEMITKKAEIGIVQNAITPILHSERSVTAVKQIDLEMVQVSLKENSSGEEIIPKNLEIGLALSVTILISPSEINATVVKLIDLVRVANQNPEAEAMNAVVLDLKEEITVAEEDGRQAVVESHVDLDSEALVEAVRGVIDLEEGVVGAEFGAPQHSFRLNPSKSHGEQGGYALGRSSRA